MNVNLNGLHFKRVELQVDHFAQTENEKRVKDAFA